MTLQGVILKGIGGFYKIETADKVYECKARGIFRKSSNITLYAGDNVIIDILPDGTGLITDILERKNSFLRPPIANIDNLFIVCSTVSPSPATINIDKITVLAVKQHILPILIVTKTDLSDADKILNIYNTANIQAIPFSSTSNKNTDIIYDLLRGKKSAFTGNSGVGKSTLLNCLFKDLCLETSPISQKLNRGKHTTRHTELYKVGKNSYVADTPGFSQIDLRSYNLINDCSELAECFPEFCKYTKECRFSGCTHTCENGCAVIAGVNNGEIAKSRFESYLKLYDELKKGNKKRKKYD